MKVLDKAVIFAFAFTAVSGVAAAADQTGKTMTQPGAPGSSAGASGTMSSFQELDKDNNGYIDASEAAGIGGVDMQAADKDNDGRLSRTEYQTAAKSDAQKPHILSPGVDKNPSTREPTGPVPESVLPRTLPKDQSQR